MTATLLPIPDDPRFAALIAAWTTEYEHARYVAAGPYFPRSVWLHDFEALLREFYPSANSRSLSLTARHAAPFPLRDGPNVP